jgi:hypothetical protein
MRTMTKAALACLTLVATFASPATGQEPVETGNEMAVRVEAMAATLHDHADRWGHAAALYQAAAELRTEDDAKAQKDLFAAAQLYLETGSVGRSIDMLELAATRALDSGDPELAWERFADAALVARHAGLTGEHRRLSYRLAELARAAATSPSAGTDEVVDAGSTIH